MKKFLFVAFVVFGGIVFYINSEAYLIQNLLEKGVKQFDAECGQILIINTTKNLTERKYGIGNYSFSPLNEKQKAGCFAKSTNIHGEEIIAYSCTIAQNSPKEVEAVAFAKIRLNNQDYELWVALNRPKQKKETYGFVTAPWNALPLLYKLLNIFYDFKN